MLLPDRLILVQAGPSVGVSGVYFLLDSACVGTGRIILDIRQWS